ncbi:MAG: UDP-N-acetylmuramoyl-tripeptide--D-alanyl-D-alanine ligase [Pseudomonadota bacterium]
MSTIWTAAKIAEATGGTARGDFAISGVAFDSREVGPGDLFIAMRGEQADGHAYIDGALKNGAAGVISEKPLDDAPHVLVEDSFAALNALGHAARARTNATIIGVTGSAGKTGTKEALYLSLSRAPARSAHRSVKSYNNHVGVPLSLARMDPAVDYGVFEMGMNHAAELSALTQIVRPHIAIITTIGPAHIENFDDESGIAHAKAEIFEGLEPDGTAIIPIDNLHYPILRAKAETCASHILTFGSHEDADIRLIDAVPAMEGGTLVTARMLDRMLVYRVAEQGEHWVMNSLAVMAAVHAAGGDLALAGLAMSELPGLAGRGATHDLSLEGGAKVHLIDESYNANPASMAVTLKTFSENATGRKVAVLGAMKELGDRSEHYHAELVHPIVAAEVDHCILVGEELQILGKRLAEAVEYQGGFDHVADASAALDQLRAIMADGDTVLVKGSNSVNLGSVVRALTDGET